MPVYFLSLVGVDESGKVDNHESIFDIYTHQYEFLGCDVVPKSAQDLRDYHDAQTKGVPESERNKEKVDIYSLVEYFIQHNPNAHYVLDEVPFLSTDGKCKSKLNVIVA